MLIDEQAHCVLEYNSALHCVMQTWKDFGSSEEFRQSILKTVQFFQKSSTARHIISNAKQQAAVKKEDAEWVATEINPILVQHGLCKLAFVVPESIATKLGVEHFTKTSQEKPEIRYFSELERATAWIAERS